ncbi:Mannosyl phosphorylinositol ceramide synthase SUR1 [Geosmithia morbida]|uniref:Mannosyl phosphorylinositol ceramide synthase SUR1 n=1 Tax=Geosmithia morbida TaxID=1094350 RepID=A0A9P5D5L7_9HYPO|nr:Mannosyl phosphorylinositol ceramide synthase SUR1 [Geosmithia morbida]KAF4124681.1 Mannosyl phosphorylinositol ceramide synthase SUR1 [Geosmithia morbida]
MRLRSGLILAVGVLLPLALLFHLRGHIYQLGEVAVTYSTFYELIRNHADLLYRYPAPASSPDGDETGDQPAVPRILHSVVLGNASRDDYVDALDSCTTLHPDWEHIVWTDESATAFIGEHYPDILPHYQGYAQHIQRANVLRYAVLHHHGGVYLDLDVWCRVALDATPIVRLPFVSPGAHPAGVNNAFISSRPGHPLLGAILAAVPSHDRSWGLPMRIPYVENMMSTGCMYYTNVWMSYVRGLVKQHVLPSSATPDHPPAPSAGNSSSFANRVFVLADTDGQLGPQMLRGKVTTPLFTHGGASSWHSWDAALVLSLSRHYVLYALVAPVVVVALSLAACSLVRRRRLRLRHRGWTAVGSWWSPAEDDAHPAAVVADEPVADEALSDKD